MPKKVVKSKKGKKENLKEEFRKMLIESIMKDVKKKKVKECTSSCKPVKKEVKKKVRSKRMRGGDNFVKDLQRAGKGVGLSIQHTFQSMSNLSKDLYCETESIMNIGNELDSGTIKDCPFTKTKSWDYNKIKQ